MLVVSKMSSDLPEKHIIDFCYMPDNINLTDPLYHVLQKKLHLLLFYDLVCYKKIKPNKAGLYRVRF